MVNEKASYKDELPNLYLNDAALLACSYIEQFDANRYISIFDTKSITVLKSFQKNKKRQVKVDE